MARRKTAKRSPEEKIGDSVRAGGTISAPGVADKPGLDKEADAAAGKPPRPEPEPVTEEAPEAPEIPGVTPAKITEGRVAPGKMISSKKGLLSAGNLVKAEYLGGGQKALQGLIDSGYVVAE